MNGRIVVAAYAKGAGGKPATVFNFRLCALLLQQLKQRLILGLGGHDYHVFEVLGSGTYQGDAAYVDFSIMSASEAPLATVCSNGYRSTITRSISGMSYCFICA